MRITNKVRFTCFVVTIMLSAGCIGYAIGTTAFASDQTPETVEPVETVKETETVIEESPVTIEFEDLGVYTITAYCGCEQCCGQWSSDPVIGAGGVELIEGVHCASTLPLGTVIEIEGIGTFEVQDRTAEWVAEKYDDKIIDIYFENHEDAVKFAKQTARVKKMVEV